LAVSSSGDYRSGRADDAYSDEGPARTIVCVDCGATAHLLTYPDEDGDFGEVLTYRCSGCGDRWDIVADEDDDRDGT
jgi:hypothetical protein